MDSSTSDWEWEVKSILSEVKYQTNRLIKEYDAQLKAPGCSPEHEETLWQTLKCNLNERREFAGKRFLMRRNLLSSLAPDPVSDSASQGLVPMETGIHVVSREAITTDWLRQSVSPLTTSPPWGPSYETAGEAH